MYKPPLAIHFIWHPTDNSFVEPLLDAIRKSFARDVTRPFSRGLNIPLFFYSSNEINKPPENIPKPIASKNILFIFTSVNTFGIVPWQKYIDEEIKIKDDKNTKTFDAVPIAIGTEGLGHSESGNLKGINALRSDEWQGDSVIRKGLLAIAHEIYRYGFGKINNNDKGTSSSIKIFLSHAKPGDVGRLYAEDVKKFIDNTNMSRFFDATDISPGFDFEKEIGDHLKESTLLSFCCDIYTSRYWCQKEILSAKEKQIPIVAIDCLTDYEDRVFPAYSNFPCVHVSPTNPLSEKDILRILLAAMLETIRYRFTIKSLEEYQNQGWIEGDCALLPNPPEIYQIASLISNNKKKFCYPEPPLYEEETAWMKSLGIEAFTPLLKYSEKTPLKNIKIGISVSKTGEANYATHHLHNNHLTRLTQDLARYLLAESATILYGGDLRKDGFTQFILDEAIALKNRFKTEDIHVENHLAWPLYVTSNTDIIAWRAKYKSVMNTEEHEVPSDIKDQIDKDVYLFPNCTENKYIWSRCLTKMRQESIENSDIRICAGGKLSGYKGKMPGVLEEIIIAIEKKKPIYLLGAFGGVVGEVCKSIENKEIAEPLTEEWQNSYNIAYAKLQEKARSHNHHADYKQIEKTLTDVKIEDLAKLTGLSEEEYKNLMKSPFIDECVYLIIKSLKKLKLRRIKNV